VLQTRESYNNHEDVYKVGRTNNSCLGRLNNPNYPNGSKVFLNVACVDGLSTEKKILEVFDDMFTRCDICKLYGKEYFNGNIDKMMKCILREIENINLEFSYMNKHNHNHINIY
jgi:hypothetical protein